ncbi:uncharacterized protein FTJAE_7491 [Fusarium tjaetaba]|uniref:Uncharacterized protein n=1 Tax=Fusarium tjaetaba TaxID=1567544 RepID=A0A8H5RCV3_9HYPO|nr:uncharacterized protein FTJAE_7491 [Fusarium tjaetaba]KAF5632381.1 hypothetical protein FTJAE_7491 [Fusarium tjaetaba]
MNKPALDHMPPEILADICWYLCSHCTNDHLSHYPQPNSLATPDPGKLWEKPPAEVATGLLSLARACRVLNNAATPYIYHNIDVRRWSKKKITEFLNGRRQLPETSFIHCPSFDETIPEKPQEKLHDLRYLHLESTSSTHTRDLSILEGLFEMAPNIRTIAIKSGDIGWDEYLNAFPNVPLANITCLKLFNMIVESYALEEILYNCRPLESFIYISQRGRNVTPSKLQYTLHKSSPTLRYLECCWHSIDGDDYEAPMMPLLIRSLKMFRRLQTLVLGGDSLSIGIPGKDDANNAVYVKNLDPTSLVELLPASIVEVRIDSKHLHKDIYQPMVALCQAKQAGSFPELRSSVQTNFDVSEVPYTLRNLSELSDRYQVAFKQEVGSVFPPPLARLHGEDSEDSEDSS